MKKIPLFMFLISMTAFSQLDSVEVNSGSVSLQFFCDSNRSFYKAGKVDSTEAKKFLSENHCKGKFLSPLQVLGAKQDYKQVKCDRDETAYIVALTGKCLPEEVGAVEIGRVKDLMLFLSKYKPRRAH